MRQAVAADKTSREQRLPLPPVHRTGQQSPNDPTGSSSTPWAAGNAAASRTPTGRRKQRSQPAARAISPPPGSAGTRASGFSCGAARGSPSEPVARIIAAWIEAIAGIHRARVQIRPQAIHRRVKGSLAPGPLLSAAQPGVPVGMHLDRDPPRRRSLREVVHARLQPGPRRISPGPVGSWAQHPGRHDAGQQP